ncbi:DUF1761 domain-containing protein [Thermoproteota archaeon]
MENISINLLAVSASALSFLIVGGVFYSKPVFGKMWMALARIKDTKGAKKAFVIAFFAAFIMSYVLAYILKCAKAGSVMDGISIAFWLWLGFIIPITLGSVLWEKQPFKLFMLNNACYLISLIVMSVILTIWV